MLKPRNYCIFHGGAHIRSANGFFVAFQHDRPEYVRHEYAVASDGFAEIVVFLKYRVPFRDMVDCVFESPSDLAITMFIAGHERIGFGVIRVDVDAVVLFVVILRPRRECGDVGYAGIDHDIDSYLVRIACFIEYDIKWIYYGRFVVYVLYAFSSGKTQYAGALIGYKQRLGVFIS